MNSDSPHSSREELEARLTALLLGELPVEEVASLQQAIAQDAELSRLHDRLKQAIGLVRETVTSPEQETLASPDAPKLSPERRAVLLGAFKVIRPKELKKASRSKFPRRELVAVAAMVLVLCLAGVFIILPNFVRARSAAQRQHHYVARDEELAEAAATAKPYARGEDGRVSVSGKPTDLNGMGRTANFSEAQPRGAATLTGDLSPGGTPPQDAVASLSVGLGTEQPPSAFNVVAKPEVRSFSTVADVPPPPPPAQPLLPPPAPASDAKQSGERAVRQIAAIALPALASDALSTSSEDKNNAWAGQSVDVTRSPLLAGSSIAPDSAARGGSGGGRGVGGAGLGAEPKLEDYVGFLAGRIDGQGRIGSGDASGVNPTGTANAWAQPTTPAPGAPGGVPLMSPPLREKPAERDSSLAYGIAPVPVPAGPAANLELTRNEPSLLAAKDDAVRLKEIDMDQRVTATNAFVTRYPRSAGVSAQQENWRFGDVASSQAQDTGALRGFIVPTLEPERLRRLDDLSDFARPDVNGAVDGYRFGTPDPGVVGGKDAVVAEKKLAELSKSERLGQANAGTTLHFDAEGKNIVRDLQRESGLKADEKPQVAQQSADGDAAVNKRFKIALPESERGEAKEKLRVATGPVAGAEILSATPDSPRLSFQQRLGGIVNWAGSGPVVTSEIMANEPATGLLAQKQAGVSLAAEDILRRQGGQSPTTPASKTPAPQVTPVEKFDTKPQQEFQSVVIPIKSARVGDVAGAIASWATSDHRAVKAITDERINSLLVFASKADLNSISNIISGFDSPVPKLAVSDPIPQPEVITTENFFSTFSLNVSDVSFKLAAAALEKGQMPDPATVRSEEFINAFDYRDPEPQGSAPIAFAWERARYPFAHDRDLLRFSVKTAASGRQPGRPLNLVLLLDNSGSMERADRVRIRQECLRVLADQLQPQDRVSVVAFARTARLWVDGLPGSQAGELSQRAGGLTPEGGTNLEDAMNLAYQTALRHFLANGVNRVVVLTDGAANLGDVEPESLKKKVEAHRKQGVALDCFGIGWDGLNDELLEALSRNGDGRYGFVNTPEAATTEFATQLAGALKVAASDVKVQVEWNPRRVTAYRQIGYAKHQLKKEQFRDNTVDAAEIGAAEAGNALYTVQVNPRGEGPIGTVRVRFKVPSTGDYREHEWAVPYEGAAKPLDQSSPAIRLAAGASAFSEWLVSSPFAAEVTPDKLLGQLNGVPEVFPADPRPKKLEWMIRQAKSVAGK